MFRRIRAAARGALPPGLALRGPRYRVAWLIAVLVAAVLAGPFFTYLAQPGSAPVKQVVEAFDNGQLVVAGSTRVEGAMRVDEYGYYLPPGGSGSVTYTIEKDPGLGLALALWVNTATPGVAGTTAVALDGGPYFVPRLSTVAGRELVDLPGDGRSNREVSVRITAANTATGDRLILDQLEWTAYRGARSAPAAPLAPWGLGLLIAVLALAFIVPRRAAPALAAGTGLLVAVAAAIRLPILQSYSFTVLDPDAIVYRIYGDRFQWWPPNWGLFCGCYGEREPFYPMLIRAFFGIVGSSDFHIRCLSLCLSLLMVVMAIVAARQLVTPAPALVVGALLAFNQPLALESVRGLRTELEGVLLLTVFAVSIRPLRRPWPDGAAAGLAGAALALTRTFFVPLVGVAVAVAALAAGRRRQTLAAAALALAIAGAATVAHRVALYEVPHQAGYSAVHNAFYDDAGYVRWLANVEKFGNGYPLPHPELFPTEAEFQAQGPYAGPPLSTYQYFFVIHTPRQVFVETVQGYVDIWQMAGGLRIPGPAPLWLDLFLDTAIRWIGLIGLLALLATARRDPRRLLIPAILVTALAFVAFSYHRHLIEPYRNVMQLYPLYLVAGAWVLQQGAYGEAGALGRSPRAALSRLYRRRATLLAPAAAAVALAAAVAAATLALPPAGIAALGILAALALAGAAYRDAGLGTATLLAGLLIAGQRLGILLESAAAASIVARAAAVRRVPRLAPAGLLPLPVALALGGIGAASWHPTGSGLLAAGMVAGALVVAAAAGDDFPDRLAARWPVVAALLAAAAAAAQALHAGWLPVDLSRPNGTLAAFLAPAPVLATIAWRSGRRWWQPAAGAVAGAVATAAVPVLGLAALLAAVIASTARPRSLVPAAAMAAAAAAGVVALALAGPPTVAPSWHAYTADPAATLVQSFAASAWQGADRIYVYGRAPDQDGRMTAVVLADGQMIASDLQDRLPQAKPGWGAVALPAGARPSEVALAVRGEPNASDAYLEVEGVYGRAAGVASDVRDASGATGSGLLLVLPGDAGGPFALGLALPGRGTVAPLGLRDDAFAAGEEHASPAARAQADIGSLWPAALSVARRHPIFGIGTGGLASALESRGLGAGLTTRDAFLQALAEGGWMGLAGLIAALAFAAWRSLRGPGRLERLAVLAAVLVGLAAQSQLSATAAAASTAVALAWVSLPHARAR